MYEDEGIDSWLEEAYEERYEGEDYNLWEEEQVFQDHEGEDDALDLYLEEMDHELSFE